MLKPAQQADGSANPSPPAGALAPFGYRAFREAWLGNTASQLGSQVQMIAAAWLMTELTTRHTLIAAVPASTALPMLLLSVPAGALADNFDRRRIMLLGQWAMLVVSAVLAALAYAGQLGPWSLLTFTLAVGAGMALVLPSWSASVRSQVDPPVFAQAISLNSISFNLARSLGPALGGLVLATLGVAAAFALNALSYIAMIVALVRWRPELPPPRREPLMRSIRAGLVFCWSNEPMRRVQIRGAAFAFGAMALQGLLPPVLRETLRGNEAEFGLLLGAFGVGSILGAFFTHRLRQAFGAEHVLALSALTSCCGLFGLALAPSVAVLLPLMLLGGAGWTMCLISLNVATQMRAPPEILGRCMAIFQAVSMGAAAIGAWSWGLLADAASTSLALYAAAAWLLVSTLVLRVLVPLPARGEGVVFNPG
jgi:MFS family permease